MAVSIGREISFVRNRLKWFRSCLTHMYSKNKCLIVSSYEWQNEHRGVFISPKVKSILFRYNLLWSIWDWKNYVESYLFWPLLVIYKSFFQSEFSFGKTLPKYFWEVDLLPADSSNTEYISLTVKMSNTITLLFLIRWWSCTTQFFPTFF